MSLDELRTALKEYKLSFGTNLTLKHLKLGKAKKVFLASNCPQKIKDQITQYPVEVVQLKEPSMEIALLCKKPFAVSVLSY